MKIILIMFFLFIAPAFSQNFSYNIALIGQFPQCEFKDEGVGTGLGLDLNIAWYPLDKISWGLNFGGSEYGSSKRKIPFNFFSDLIFFSEKTTNDIMHGHFFLRLIPFNGDIRPYFEGLIGMKNLSTSTKLYNDVCVDNLDTTYDDCKIASSTHASDNSLSYGVGGGLELTLTQIEGKHHTSKKGVWSFFVSARYLLGSKTKYLKEGAIGLTNPEDGPVQTTFNWSASKTDLLQVNIGLQYDRE
jgi:hypothetical protein